MAMGRPFSPCAPRARTEHCKRSLWNVPEAQTAAFQCRTHSLQGPMSPRPEAELVTGFWTKFLLREPQERHMVEAAGPQLCFPSGSALGAPPAHTCHNCSSTTQKANAMTRDHGGFTGFPCMFCLLTVSCPDVQNSSSFSVVFGKLHRDTLKYLTYRFSEFRQDAVSVVQTQLHFAIISRCLIDMKHQARSLEVM